jgi:demethylmenaquinone methyltransferase/2-methoxy-6-polyprenyl-1,4-benzoquinol methylase
VARKRASRSELDSAVSLAQGDGASLPLKAQAFDAVFVSFTLELFDTPEIPQVLAECRRVLRDGGRLAVVSLSKAGGAGWMTRAYEWGHSRWPALLDCRPIFVEAAVGAAGFHVRRVRHVRLSGLAVEAVLASCEAGRS